MGLAAEKRAGVRIVQRSGQLEVDVGVAADTGSHSGKLEARLTVVVGILCIPEQSEEDPVEVVDIGRMTEVHRFRLWTVMAVERTDIDSEAVVDSKVAHGFQ